jgi:hypothetical protein
MPAIMTGRMSEHEWYQFCDQVDKHLAPLNKIRMIIFAGTLSVFLGFLIVMIVTIASPNSFFSSTVNNDFNSNSPSPFFFMLIPFGLMILMLVVSCYGSVKMREGFNSIKSICEERSKLHNDISFHLRDDRLVTGGYSGYRTYNDIYILVSLNSINVIQLAMHTNRIATATTVEDPEVGGVNSLNSVDKSSVSTVVERLIELEGIRHMLTTHEYCEKKNEILTGI